MTTRSQPWMILAEAFRHALSPKCLAFALVGVVLTILAWQAAGAMLLSSNVDPHPPAAVRFHRRVASWQPRPEDSLIGSLPWMRLNGPAGPGSAPPQDPVLAVPLQFVTPFHRLFSFGASWSLCFYYLWGGLLTVGIWSFCGTAITRSAVMHCGLGRRITFVESLRFAKQYCWHVFYGVTLPLVGIALLALPFIPLGWLMKLDIGVFVGGLLWLFVLVAGSLMAVLSLGLMFGWPLMWGTICTEKSDGFDAISRSYAYTFQSPLHYLFYLLIAGVLGTLGWLVAWWLSESAIALSLRAVELGSGSHRVTLIRAYVDGTQPFDEAAGSAMVGGVRLMIVSNTIIRCLASAFSYSYFWCMAGAIYLLLRRDTDQTELDDVILDRTKVAMD